MASLTDVLASQSWHLQAACHGHEPELWWAERDKPKAQAAAVDICRGCPVQQDCLQYAMDNREHEGIWGGLLPHQRRRLAVHLREAVA